MNEDNWRFACINCKDKVDTPKRNLSGDVWSGWYCNECCQSYQVAYDLKKEQPVAAQTNTV